MDRSFPLSSFFQTMSAVTIKPRIQSDKWSLYWKETLETSTISLPQITLSITDETTLSQLVSVAARELGWQPVELLSRLPGFVSPFERVIQKGRELDLNTLITTVDLTQPLVLIRISLKADGWKIALKDDPFASDSDDSDEEI